MLPAVAFNDLQSGSPGTSSSQMREQVMQARAFQAKRFEKQIEHSLFR